MGSSSKVNGTENLEPLNISDRVRQFIFDHIDSVEQIEVLFYLWMNSDNYYDAETIGRELRLSPASIKNRLKHFHEAGFVQRDATDASKYSYKTGHAIENIISEMSEHYRIRKHRILELIFSPAKRARSFANAFSVKKHSGDGDSNG